MAYRKLSFKISGVVPLLMHNGQLADPSNEHAEKIRKLTSKRDKTRADYDEIARLEFLGSLYLKDGKPCIPGELLEAALIAAARKQKKGKQAQSGIICPESYALSYEGPKDPMELWKNESFRLRVGVVIKQARTMRTRPKFKKWSCKVEVEYNESLLNEADVKHFLGVAGEDIGLGDWRPKYGRFKVE